MRKATLLALIGFSFLQSSSYLGPNIIYEEFIDQEKDGYVEMYIVSTPRYPEKTRILISREFTNKICEKSGQNEEMIRINYNSRFTSGLGQIKPQIMDKITQQKVNERNKLAVLTNGLITTY
jgi:hypothetical protein